MSPESFLDLEKTVDQYAASDTFDGGWKIDALEDGDPDRLNGYPFATAEAVGVHLSYAKNNTTLAADITSNPSATWRDFLPSISWKRVVNRTRHECVLSTAGLIPRFAYKLLHPEFTFSSTTNLSDGLSSHLTASTRLSAMSQLGVSAVYDPSRSGLVDYTALLTRKGCDSVCGSDMVIKYNATCGLGVHTRIPVNPFTSAVIIAERNRFLMGASVCSPCGAQLNMNVNVFDSKAAITMTRNINDIWKMRLSTSFPLSDPRSGKVGVVFTSQNVL